MRQSQIKLLFPLSFWQSAEYIANQNQGELSYLDQFLAFILCYSVIWRFFSNADVMHVTLAHSRSSDLNKLSFSFHRINVFASGVTHALVLSRPTFDEW